MASLGNWCFLVQVFTIFLIGVGSTLRVDTNPEPFNHLIQDELNVTCVPDGPFYWAKQIVMIQMGKVGEEPIAVVNNKQELILGPGSKPNMQADGRVEKDASHCFLTVTIKNPGIADVGTYYCQLSYFDELYKVKTERVFGNVTIDDQDMSVVLTYLAGKVSRLEKIVQERGDVIAQQNQKIENLIKQRDQGNSTNFNCVQRVLSVVNKAMSSQGKEIVEQKNRLDEYQRKISDQGKQLQEQKEKASFRSAFSAGYQNKDKVESRKILVFSHTYINEGGDYDNTTGVYTAPRDGLYVFNLVVGTAYIDGYVYIYLVVNNRNKARLYARDKYDLDQSSVSTVVSLKTGDQVWSRIIDISKGSLVLPQPYSVFTGYLLKLS